MKLKIYEIKVIELLLKNKLSENEWMKFLDICDTIDIDYEYTGAGYFLKLKITNLNLKKATLDTPTVIGETKNFTVGFIIYTDQNEIVIECHSWSEFNPPKNMRELDIEIKIINLN